MMYACTRAHTYSTFLLGCVADYCYRPSSVVCLSVCLSVGLSHVVVRPAKTAEPIEMPFGLWTWVDLGNHVLDGVHISHGKGAILREERADSCKVYRLSAVSCAKTAEPIEMPFGINWTRVGPRKHY